MEDVKVSFSLAPPYAISDPVFLLPVVGTLKGYDQLMNLVLDDVQEMLRGMDISVVNVNTGN